MKIYYSLALSTQHEAFIFYRGRGRWCWARTRKELRNRIHTAIQELTCCN